VQGDTRLVTEQQEMESLQIPQLLVASGDFSDRAPWEEMKTALKSQESCTHPATALLPPVGPPGTPLLNLET